VKKQGKRSALARRASRLMNALPQAGPREFPVLSGRGQQGVPVVGPGWYGMVPALYTQQRSFVVFIPYDLFSTLLAFAPSEGVPIHVVAGQGDQELVAKLYKEG